VIARRAPIYAAALVEFKPLLKASRPLACLGLLTCACGPSLAVLNEADERVAVILPEQPCPSAAKTAPTVAGQMPQGAK
jgi:hypothetical protein